MPVSCHFRDCKVVLVTSLTHVRGAIASTRPLPLPLSGIRRDRPLSTSVYVYKLLHLRIGKDVSANGTIMMTNGTN